MREKKKEVRKLLAKYLRENHTNNTVDIDKQPMFSNEINSSLWPCLDSIFSNRLSSTNVECIVCRLGGIIIFSLSVICLIFNLRYFFWYYQTRCQNTLVLSLFLTSFLVLILSVPGVLLQLFSCRRHCNEFYCRVEGFITYFSGCLCMLIYMMLSINRYYSIRQYTHPFFSRYSTISCWLLSFLWTFPPMFNFFTSYVPEGLGFHCSINWNDYSQANFYYILCSFTGIYFLPLLILLVVNVRVHRIIRNIYSSSYVNYHQQHDMSEGKMFLSSKRQLDHRLKISSCYIQKAVDRKRLRVEYRFIKAIFFLVSAYIIAWTPYSIIALLQLFHVHFILNYAFFITLSAFIAKLSVIFAPFVYLSIMNGHLFKKILF